MLPHPGGDDRLALGQLVEQADRILRLDNIGRIVKGEREGFAPGVDLDIPFGKRRETCLGSFFSRLAEEGVQPAQRVFDITQNGEFYDLVLVDLRVVDVDVNNRSVLGKFANFSGDAVVKSDPDRQQEVGFVDRIICINRSMHSQPFQREFVRLGEASNAHQGCRHWNAGSLYKLPEFRRRLSRNDPSAAVDHWALCGLNEADHFIEREVVCLGNRRVATQVHLVGENRLGCRQLDIFGNINEHGTGASTLGDVKGLFHNSRDVVHIHHEVIVFDDLSGDAENVGLLKSPFADHRLRYLSGDCDQGSRVQIGIGDPRD